MGVLLALLLKETVPAAIELVKSHHATILPDLPPLTDQEALLLLQQAVNSSVTKDDNWLAAHR